MSSINLPDATRSAYRLTHDNTEQILSFAEARAALRRELEAYADSRKMKPGKCRERKINSLLGYQVASLKSGTPLIIRVGDGYGQVCRTDEPYLAN